MSTRRRAFGLITAAAARGRDRRLRRGHKHRASPGRDRQQPQRRTRLTSRTPTTSGIYEAQAKGYFKQADLNVHLHAPTNAATPLQLLESGKVDVAISYEPDVLLARNQNMALVSVAAIVQRPLTSIVSVGSQNITSPKDLRGRRSAPPGIPYQTAFLQTILQHAHVPASSVKQVDVGEGSGTRDGVRQGRRDARRLLELRGDPAGADAQGPERDPHGPGGRAHLRRARVRRPQGHDRQPCATDPPFRPGGRQGLPGSRANPVAGDAEPREHEPGAQVQAPAGERPRDDVVVLPGRPPPLGLAGPQGSGTRSATG